MFLNVCKQTFHILHVRISQKLKSVLIWNLQHNIFNIKTKILADFQICISVPLTFKRAGHSFPFWLCCTRSTLLMSKVSEIKQLEISGNFALSKLWCYCLKRWIYFISFNISFQKKQTSLKIHSVTKSLFQLHIFASYFAGTHYLLKSDINRFFVFLHV